MSSELEVEMHNKLYALAIVGVMALAGSVKADPPPGKGNPNAGQPGTFGNGNQGKANQGKGSQAKNNDQRDAGSAVLESVLTGLVVASITQSDARNLALQYGLTGYSPLPPGIQKNLARGKPLPPGIAKKLVPGPMLSRLPQYSGYEWRVAGTELILVNLATLAVAEVLQQVFD